MFMSAQPKISTRGGGRMDPSQAAGAPPGPVAVNVMHSALTSI